MKKWVALVSITALIGIGAGIGFMKSNYVFGEQKVAQSEDVQVSSLSASIVGFDSLDELEKGSTIVVRAEKVSEGNQEVQKDPEGLPYLYTTISPFKVTSVLEGDLKVDSIIQLSEPTGMDKNKNVRVTVENYKPMDLKKEYLLFLDDRDKDGIYTVIAVNKGKFTKDGNIETYDDKDHKPKNYEKLENEVKGKYVNK